MSNRTTYVDNNTWNFTHIGTVGKILVSDEDTAYKMCRDLDANYVMVNFGGYSGFKADDYIKMLWLVRIAHDAYPDTKEQFYVKNGAFDLTENGLTDKTAESIMFKFLFHRFGEIQVTANEPPGYDHSRNQQIDGSKLDIRL